MYQSHLEFAKRLSSGLRAPASGAKVLMCVWGARGVGAEKKGIRLESHTYKEEKKGIRFTTWQSLIVELRGLNPQEGRLHLDSDVHPHL